MKLKLNRSKMTGVADLIDYLVTRFPAQDPAEKILNILVLKIRIKIQTRLIQFNAKDKYNVNLPEEEALAFQLWFSQKLLPEGSFTYEIHIAEQICADIDKTYGNDTNRNQRVRELAARASGR